MPFDEAAALLMTYGTSQHALTGPRAAASRAKPCWCWARRAASAWRRWNWARRWARASSRRHRARRSWRWRASMAPMRACNTRAAPLDKTAARALTDRFKAACGARRRPGHLRSQWAATTRKPRCARSRWQGRHLVVGFTAGIPKLPLNLTLLKSCQIIGVFWGEFTTRDSGGACRQCRGAHGAVSRGPHQAGGHRTLSAGARRRGDRAGSGRARRAAKSW